MSDKRYEAKIAQKTLVLVPRRGKALVHSRKLNYKLQTRS